GAEVPELAGRPVGERRNAQHTAHGERRDQDEQSGGEGGGDPPGPQPGGVDGAGVPVAAHAVPPDTEPNPVTRPIPRGNADNRRWQGFAGRAGRGNGRRRGGKRTEAPRRLRGAPPVPQGAQGAPGPAGPLREPPPARDPPPCPRPPAVRHRLNVAVTAEGTLHGGGGRCAVRPPCRSGRGSGAVAGRVPPLPRLREGRGAGEPAKTPVSRPVS